ncbi:MAG: exosortase/archaeosortase family protein [Synechococcaceae cyanobacterium]|jgi:cyanoexosortase A
MNHTRSVGQLSSLWFAKSQEWLIQQWHQRPPATPRNLWLLIAAVIAIQNIAVFHTSQSANNTVYALLVWGGAVICMEDQIETLEPRPSFLSLIVGTIILILVLARTAIVLHWEGIVFALPPFAGLGLAFLCYPFSKILRLRDSLLALLLIPAYALLMRVLPEEPISLLTAKLAGLFLQFIGFDTVVQGRSVAIPGGGVRVLAACNGLDMMSQIICVSIVFLLAFPIRSTLSRIFLLISAPLVGLLSNAFRIAILAWCTSFGSGKGSPMFKFFHDDAGSLVFSGIAVFVFGWLYLVVLEKELSALEANNLPNAE